MVDWTHDNASRAIRDELSGSAGLAIYPPAAAPANGISLAEVIRYLHATLSGTATGENGITTWPAAAAPGNTVSIAEAIRYIVETQIGTIANSGGTATLGGIIGDLANSSLLTRLNLLQCLTPATYVPGLGFRVLKTENINTATGVDLFTVTGKVLVTLWTGEVTNALAAGVSDYKLRVKTSNIDLCAASNIGSAAVGFIWQMNNDAGDTLINTASATETADLNGKSACGRIVGKTGGTCVLQSNRTAGDSGDEMKHILFYLPLEASASVAAAA